MIRGVLRFLGLVFLAAAFLFVINDGTKSIGSNMYWPPYMTKLGDFWHSVHSTSLQLLQPAIERHVAQWLWDPVALSVLTSPAWLVLGILGVVLILLGRKKKPLIGYARD